MKYSLYFFLFFVLAGCCNSNTGVADLESVDLKWDFSQKKRFVYSFSQTIDNSYIQTKNGAVEDSYTTATGNLNIEVTENNLANLSLTNIIMTVVIFNENGLPIDTMSSEMPTTTVEDMGTDGSFSSEDINVLFAVLLPLPKNEIELNKSEELPLEVPFNAGGSLIVSKGFNTLTYTGIETFLNRKCAVITGEIQVSDMEMERELMGKYKNINSGKATYYFDIENKCYVGADVQFAMEMLMDTESVDSTYGTYMDLKNDNVFEIRLDRIEDL